MLMVNPSLLPPDSTSALDSVLILVAPSDAVRLLREVFRSLQGDFPGAIVILLRRGTGHERGVADNLNSNPSVMVSPGVDGVRLRNGHAYVVWSDAQLALVAGDRLAAGQSQSLIESTAQRYGVRAFAVALTALDDSECEGFARVRAAGGKTLSLDETDRLWASPAGPRVVPHRDDELLSTTILGPRLVALATR